MMPVHEIYLMMSGVTCALFFMFYYCITHVRTWLDIIGVVREFNFLYHIIDT